MTNTISIRANGVRYKKALLTALRETLGTFRWDELEVEHMADPADEVRWAMEREIAGRHLDQRAQRAREIRAALDRVEEGTFGACERCEETIGAKRLEAVPWARLCVTCQDQAEQATEVRPVFRLAA